MAARNLRIKKANIQSEYDDDKASELWKCSKDPIHFIENYVVLQHPTLGAIPFNMYDFQKDIIASFLCNRNVIIKAARQSGKSIIVSAYLLWFAIFNFDKTILIVSNKNKGAMEMIKRIQFAYEELPAWLKPGISVVGWNKHAIGFDNGSIIESCATSENSGRGSSISLLFCDELAFVRPAIQQEFWTSISPTLSTGGSSIIASTPNGDNDLYAELWRGAISDINGFVPIDVPWTAVPGRDETFKQAEIAKIGEQKWLQEYLCEFITSDSVLISPMILKNISKGMMQSLGKKHEVVFWKEPNPDDTYIVGIDPSTGCGDDYSVIEVFDFPAMMQVAECRVKTHNTPELYNIIKWVLKHFSSDKNDVYYTIENNGIGEGLIALYQKDENFDNDNISLISEEGRNRLGMHTSNSNKIKTCLTLKRLLESNVIHLNSMFLIDELKSFIRKGTSASTSYTFAARRGATDDCISALLMVLRIVESISMYEEKAFNTLYQYSEELEDTDYYGDNIETSNDDETRSDVYGEDYNSEFDFY